MKRLHITVEGQTEERFVNDCLRGNDWLIYSHLIKSADDLEANIDLQSVIDVLPPLQGLQS